MNYHVAFVGNPNVGKSAWINALSNADFKVGNWPGVTVEKKEANVCWGGDSYHIIDLPGTYSLTNNGNEESITAAYLQSQQVDLIVNVLDATNLQRNLMLTLFLRELQIPMLLIFNFMDEVKDYVFISIQQPFQGALEWRYWRIPPLTADIIVRCVRQFKGRWNKGRCFIIRC